MVLDCVLVDLNPPSGTCFSVPASQRQKLNHTFRFKNTDRHQKVIEIEAGMSSTWWHTIDSINLIQFLNYLNFQILTSHQSNFIILQLTLFRNSNARNVISQPTKVDESQSIISIKRNVDSSQCIQCYGFENGNIGSISALSYSDSTVNKNSSLNKYLISF